MSLSLEITQVEGRWGTWRFVDAAWRVHDQPISAGWIPPLRVVVRDGLDQRGNPFYQQAERALFIAKRNGRVVGRVAAIESVFLASSTVVTIKRPRTGSSSGRSGGSAIKA